MYETKDSGKRAEFASGMVRDTSEDKPRFDLMVPAGQAYQDTLLYRYAMLLHRGSLKYDARNWEKADGPEELERFKESAFRHFMAWFCGELDEDHAAAVLFNISAYEATVGKVERMVHPKISDAPNPGTYVMHLER